MMALFNANQKDVMASILYNMLRMKQREIKVSSRLKDFH